MAESLYRKYRPQTFSDVVGQDVIIKTLKNAIENDKLAHAYLFTGSRGTGKTTTARILAKALLCEKGPTESPDGTCEECKLIAESRHPDVLELDAASRTGVDNVREEIISRVKYAPQRGNYKVYIIDEVHMLSTAAFNALLKTLEEPPARVVFILCTTDPQKVPETIHSRCQRFDFRRISTEELTSRLGAVCNMENVEFDGEALDLIARRSNGGMRDALSTLEQIMVFGNGRVTLSVAQDMLGSTSTDSSVELAKAIANRNIASAFEIIRDAVEDGVDLAQFSDDVAWFFRDVYVCKMAGEAISLSMSAIDIDIINKFSDTLSEDRLIYILSILSDLSREIKISSNQQLTFEIALTKLFAPENSITLQALSDRISNLEKSLVSGATPTAKDYIKTDSVPVRPLANEAEASSSSSAQKVVSEPRVSNVASSVSRSVDNKASASSVSEPQQNNVTVSDKVADDDVSRYEAPFKGGYFVTDLSVSSSKKSEQTSTKTQFTVPAETNIPAPTIASERENVNDEISSTNATTLTDVVSSPAGKFAEDCVKMLEHLYVLNKSYFFLLMKDVKFSYEPASNGVKVVFPHDKNFAYGNVNKPACRDRIKTAFGEVGYVGVTVDVVKDDDLYAKLETLSVPTPDEDGNLNSAPKSGPTTSVSDTASSLSRKSASSTSSVPTAPASSLENGPIVSQATVGNISPAPAKSDSASKGSEFVAPFAVSAAPAMKDSTETSAVDVVSNVTPDVAEDSVPLDVYDTQPVLGDEISDYDIDIPMKDEIPTDGQSKINEDAEIEKMNKLLSSKFGDNVSFKFEE